MRVSSAIARLKRQGFARNVTILIGGTIGGRAVLTLALPVLTRIYSPADFELLAVYSAVLALVTVIASLRLDSAVPLPAEDAEAGNLLAASVLSALATGLILAALVGIAPAATSDLLGQAALRPYLWMIPAGIVLGASYQSLQYWATRKRRFPLVARTRVSRAIGGAGVQLGFGAMGMTPFGLLFGHLVYNGLGVVGLARDLWRQDRPALQAVSPAGMRRAISAYRRFPLYSVPEALANAGGMQIPVILIAALVAGPEAGHLALAMQLMAMPMALVGQSVRQVFIAEAPDRFRAGTLEQFTRRTSLMLFALGSAALIPIGLVSPFVFPFVFGADWARAGEIVLWMTPWHILQFAASPVSKVLHVTGHLRRAMLLQICGAVLRIGAVLVAASMASGWISEVYALSGAAFYALYVFVVIRTARGV